MMKEFMPVSGREDVEGIKKGENINEEYEERSGRLALQIAMSIIDAAKFAGEKINDDKLKQIIRKEINLAIQKQNLLPTERTLNKISEHISRQYGDMGGTNVMSSKMLSLFSEIASEYIKG